MPASGRDDCGSDIELLHQFIEKRDEGAFTILVARLGKGVWDICQTILGDVVDAEDAFQSAFIKLSQKASQAVQHKSLVAWMGAEARRNAWTTHRSRLRRKRLMENAKAAVSPSNTDPPSRIMQAEIAALLREEVDGLPEALRVPLVHRFFEDKTLAEIAFDLGCTDRAVAKRLARGEEILRRRLTKRAVSPGERYSWCAAQELFC